MTDAMTKLFEAAEWAYKQPCSGPPLRAIEAALPAAREEWRRVRQDKDYFEQEAVALNRMSDIQAKVIVDQGKKLASLRSELEAARAPLVVDENAEENIRGEIWKAVFERIPHAAIHTDLGKSIHAASKEIAKEYFALPHIRPGRVLTEETVARAIEGPHKSEHLNPEKLAELREVRWNTLGRSEQCQRINSARAILALMKGGEK